MTVQAPGGEDARALALWVVLACAGLWALERWWPGDRP